MKKKICIIGAGVAGLSVLQQIKSSEVLEATTFEKNGFIGGLWNRNSNAESPLYENMTSNVPKMMMEFRAYPFDRSKFPDIYVKWEDVFIYIQDFVEHFRLQENIQLSQEVVSVKPAVTKSDASCSWSVVTKDVLDGSLAQHEFDGVVVASGKHATPYKPKIKGDEIFQGVIRHSKDFKSAKEEIYLNKNIICLGFGLSNLDISRHLSKFAKNVYISHRAPCGVRVEILPSNCHQTATLVELTQDKGIFEDGATVDCDVVILCTGYEYSYDFLHEDCKVEILEGKYIRPLHKHIHNIFHPSLTFISVPLSTLEFRVSSIQAVYLKAFYEGKIQLPEPSEMLETLEKLEMERKESNLPYSRYHLIGTFGVDFIDYLADLAVQCGIESEKKAANFQKTVFRDHFNRLIYCPCIYRSDVIEEVDGNPREIRYRFNITSEFPQQPFNETIYSLQSDGTVKIERIKN